MATVLTPSFTTVRKDEQGLIIVSKWVRKARGTPKGKSNFREQASTNFTVNPSKKSTSF